MRRQISIEWYTRAIRKYAEFSGRASRREFWSFVLFNFIFGIVAGRVDFVLEQLNVPFSIVSWLYRIFVFVPGLSITVRRFHDIGKSGWVYMRLLILAVIVFICYAVYFTYWKPKNIYHDVSNNSVNFIVTSLLVLLFGLAYAIWLLIHLTTVGDNGQNKYGPDPMEPEAHPLDRLKD